MGDGEFTVPFVFSEVETITLLRALARWHSDWHIEWFRVSRWTLWDGLDWVTNQPPLVGTWVPHTLVSSGVLLIA